MRAVLVALVLAASSAIAHGQTVEATLDTQSLGWGAVDTPRAVETDDDLSTREWLIRSADTGMWRVAAERPDGLCAGAWFAVTTHPFTTVTVQRVGLNHKLVMQAMGDGRVTVIRLDTPRC